MNRLLKLIITIINVSKNCIPILQVSKARFKNNAAVGEKISNPTVTLNNRNQLR